jgi:hypothetical protein
MNILGSSNIISNLFLLSISISLLAFSGEKIYRIFIFKSAAQSKIDKQIKDEELNRKIYSEKRKKSDEFYASEIKKLNNRTGASLIFSKKRIEESMKYDGYTNAEIGLIINKIKA